MILGIIVLKNIFLLDTKCKHMTLCISMHNNIVNLHIRTQNYHLKYPNVLR